MPSKKTTKKVAAKKASAAKKTSTKKSAPSLEQINQAAYFIYRRRMELGLPGDQESDWAEAMKSIS